MTLSPVPVIAALAKPFVETHPVKYAWLAVGIATAAIEVAGAFRRRSEATRTDRGSLIVIRLCVIPAVIFVILSPRIAPGAQIRPPLVPVVAGLVIFSAGEALRVWAKVALGRYFTYTVQTSSDQPVITSGLTASSAIPPTPGCCCSRSASAQYGGTGSGWWS